MEKLVIAGTDRLEEVFHVRSRGIVFVWMLVHDLLVLLSITGA